MRMDAFAGRLQTAARADSIVDLIRGQIRRHLGDPGRRLWLARALLAARDLLRRRVRRQLAAVRA